VDVFDIRFQVPEDVPADVHRGDTVIRVDTSVGISGYAFSGYERPAFYDRPDALRAAILPALVGQDLFAVECHVAASCFRWGAVEHALWDAIGRVLEQPVFRLLGGTTTRLRPYLTCIWPTERPDRPGSDPHVPFEDQAAMAVRVRDAGFRGMKIGAWRTDPLENVRAIRHIRETVGDDLALMLDHAGGYFTLPPWDVATATEVARALEGSRVEWLEEPLRVDDFEGLAALAREVEVPISGGENIVGVKGFREPLVRGSFDILQPDAAISGGIATARKAAVLAEAFGTRCFLHGDGGLGVAGWIQVNAAIGAEWQELAIIWAPLLPDELWQYATQVVHGDRLYHIEDGVLHVPEGPGLGLDLDVEAIEELRVR
jgi:D-galactarolactone cycloisomerase